MILKLNSASNGVQAVRALNILLGLGVWDRFTVKTRAALKSIQKTLGVPVDGVAGPQTLAAYVTCLPEVRYGDDSGSIYVKAVQALVGAAIDGVYGSQTRANVTAFQASAGLPLTGDVGRSDWLTLWDCAPKTPAPTTPAPTTPAPYTGEVVDYKQGDRRWGKKSYTSCGNKNQTIANSGCGPTSMADIMATWIDSKITPVEMCAYAVAHGFRTKNSGTAWGFFKSIAKAYGFSKFVQTRSLAAAREALRAGALVVASMGPGYWTKGGHYICLTRTDDTYVYANDPASRTRKRQKLGPFERQRKQFFIFTR